MQIFSLPSKNKLSILALGAESAGNFSVLHQGKLFFSEDFGDLSEDVNYHRFKKTVISFLKKGNISPKIILTDLHPLYKTTLLGKELVKKYKAKHIQVQHHLAHIFSAIGESNLNSKTHKLKPNAYGIALDGTGYGLDGKIWGGEIFKLKATSNKLKTQRMGHLENQTMIGGDLAVKEPARMLIGVLAKFLSKEKIWNTLNNVSPKHDRSQTTHFKKPYTKSEFEVLHNQLQSGFNCQETSSTGRVLDAVSILLSFCQNERNFKHEPAILLERNSTKPYTNLKPVTEKSYELKATNYKLLTTPLFEYLIENINKDKKRLAATAQLYIAQGLYEIIKELRATRCGLRDFYLSGGIANNKIISEYLVSKGAIVNQKIPRGDAGISFGQIIFHLMNKRGV